jgi:uncharacterized RDD family membrane protein YckC
MLYDSLLLLALCMVATFAFLPFTGGEALTSATHPLLERVYQLVLVAITTGYFGLFWTRRGQTIGMKSWRLQLRRLDEGPPTWRDASLRLAAAVLSWLPAGLGFLWSALDAQGRAWHDRLSGTRLVLLPKQPS